MKTSNILVQVWQLTENCPLAREYCKVVSVISSNLILDCDHFDNDTEKCKHVYPPELIKCPACGELTEYDCFVSEGYCHGCAISGEGVEWKVHMEANEKE